MKPTDHLTTQDYSSLIGIPYKEKDCWGIVREFYSRVFNVKLPEFYSQTPEGVEGKSGMILKCKTGFERVDRPEFGDILLLNVLGLPSHVGIYLSEVHFIHTTEGKNCTVDRIFTWRHRIEGYYRWRHLS